MPNKKKRLVIESAAILLTETIWRKSFIADFDSNVHHRT